ncbi:MAG: pyridoxal-phosphate dependent enzyme [Opitutus sp.]|nr:pyridoxal-phosphate dependent enzyme [Opitutus sp.]
MSQPLQFLLRAEDLPTHWYNLLADFPEPLPPPLHPGTREPVTPDLMTALFPELLVAQEMSGERQIEIPQEVRDVYALYRPTPLLRAVRLERALQTPAHIYYKYEGVSPAGSHKPNTAIPQTYYNKISGTKRLATETGAGQWGSSLAFACSVFGLECNIYMVKVSFHQKPYRKLLMQTYGATVHASPSDQTDFGRKVRAEGIVPAPESSHAIAAAVDEAVKCREEGRKRVIVIGLSGNGLLDLAAYDSFLSGHRHDTGNDD